MHQLPDKVFDSKEVRWSFKKPLSLGTGLVEDPGGEEDFWVHWTDPSACAYPPNT